MFRNQLQLVALAVALSAAVLFTSCGGLSAAPINNLALGAVTVDITPATMTITTGTVQQFTATVNGSGLQNVQWQVNGVPGGAPIVGTIDNAGNYTAPQFVPIPPTVVLTAVANADNTRSGNASVTITGTQLPATVLMSPRIAALQIGTEMNLSAGVMGPNDTNVTWQVNGIPNGNASVGTITPGSNNTASYKAPAKVPNPATVTIQAVSRSEPGKVATCPTTISLQPPTVPTITITPVIMKVQSENSQAFTAEVINSSNTAVFWEVNGDVGGSQTYGTIASEGDQGVYTAPINVPLISDTVSITAAPLASPSRFSSGLVAIAPPPVLGVSVNVQGGTSVEVGSGEQVSATVQNASDQSVTWKVNGIPGGNSTYGTIQPDQANGNQAMYFAPAKIPAQKAVVVEAIPNASPTLAGTLPVTITAATVTVTVTPGISSLGVGQQETFSAAISDVADQDANWYVCSNSKNCVLGGNSTLGTIAPFENADVVTYTAPAAVPSPPSVMIKAVSEAVPSVFGTATVTIGLKQVITVTITPSNPQTVPVNESLGPYTATVMGTDDQQVNWAVNGIIGGNETIGMLIPDSGDLSQEDYIAPAVVPNPATVKVTAISVEDPTAISNADSVTVVPEQNPPSVTIDPAPYPLPQGGNEQVFAVVNNIPDHTVNWTLTLPNGQACTQLLCGTVNPIQTNNAPTTYTAPINVPDGTIVNITATSSSVPSAHDTAPITISADDFASISINPSQPPPIQAGSGQEITFTVSIKNAPQDQEMEWNLGCASEAASGFWCGSPFSNGAWTGCIIGADGAQQCSAGGLAEAGNTALTYTPPPKTGNSFNPNFCASKPGADMIPLTAALNQLTNNCNQTSCTATVCITVTPAAGK